MVGLTEDKRNILYNLLQDSEYTHQTGSRKGFPNFKKIGNKLGVADNTVRYHYQKTTTSPEPQPTQHPQDTIQDYFSDPESFGLSNIIGEIEYALDNPQENSLNELHTIRNEFYDCLEKRATDTINISKFERLGTQGYLGTISPKQNYGDLENDKNLLVELILDYLKETKTFYPNGDEEIESYLIRLENITISEPLEDLDKRLEDYVKVICDESTHARRYWAGLQNDIGEITEEESLWLKINALTYMARIPGWIKEDIPLPEENDNLRITNGYIYLQAYAPLLLPLPRNPNTVSANVWDSYTNELNQKNHEHEAKVELHLNKFMEDTATAFSVNLGLYADEEKISRVIESTDVELLSVINECLTKLDCQTNSVTKNDINKLKASKKIKKRLSQLLF